MHENYQRTIYACFTGYIVQAIINNFVPLLFLTFVSAYQISLSKVTFLVTFNFGIQLCVDLLSAKFADKIGYRPLAVLAHFFAAAGLIGLTVLPEIFQDPYTGILLSVVVYAVGGGLIEVLISPIVEACPTRRKDAVMSLLHSFYCWGHVGVVLISTLFFTLFGVGSWKILAVIWAVIPIINGIVFCRVPIASLLEEGEQGYTIGELFRMKMFWIMMLLMLCAGACEQGISQWASTYAEAGLGVTKTIGDLAGPMLFALLMGLSRTVYGKVSERIHLEKFMVLSSVLCLASYLLASLASSPLIGLIGCGLCGLSVGILWPGTFSMASVGIRRGGTAMFAFLALAGDVGCSGGPTYVGLLAGKFGDNLKMGILFAAVFPVLLLIGLLWRHVYVKVHK